jgi:hypothetical protein
MTDLVRCKTPIGRVVALTEAVWEQRIVPFRPELREHLWLIEAVLSKPLIVTRDRDDDEWRYFYQKSDLPSFESYYVRISVRFHRRLKFFSLTGVVRGVEFTTGMRSREVMVWPPQM